MMNEELPPQDENSSEAINERQRQGVPQLVKLFKVLGEERRVRILTLIHAEDGKINVKDMENKLAQHEPEVSQSSISHDLRTLKDEGLVEYKKEGKHNIYRLTDYGMHVARMLTESPEKIASIVKPAERTV